MKRRNEQGFLSVIVIIVLVIIIVVAIAFSLVNRKTGTHLKLSNGCKDTNLTLQPVSLASFDTPIILHATLTMGTQPVKDERVTFRVLVHDDKPRSYQAVIGSMQTDATGTATLKKSLGLRDDLIGLGKHVTGFEAEFDGPSATKPNETFYCGAKATVSDVFDGQ